MFNVAFHSSTLSNTNLILKLDEAERLLSRTDAPNESYYHTACASRDILAQQAKRTEACK